jgi:deoxyribonuclease-4
MSITGGFDQALLRGKDVGCDTIQMFVKSNMAWKVTPLAEEAVAKFQKTRLETGITPCVAHLSYLINIAATDPRTLALSHQTLPIEHEYTERLGLQYLVIHPGAHMGAGEERALAEIARYLNEVHRGTRGYRTKILLETTAGQGTYVCYRFEHLARILDLLEEPDRVGICYDTSHTFAAGYDIRDEKAYRKTFREFNRIVGTKRICAFHFNDSKAAFGSRVDRHEHIGRGHLGREPFRLIMTDRRFRNLPMILETPKGEEKGVPYDRINLRTLRSLLT